MALTDVAVRSAESRDEGYKLSDGAGLYLLVMPSGERLWRLKCRMHELQRKLARGRYPDVSLSKARDAARGAAGAGNDPAAAIASLQSCQLGRRSARLL